MKKYGVSDKDFKSTYTNLAINSLQFESFCTKELLAVDGEQSRLGISYWENEIISTYLPSIIENSNLLDLRTPELQRKYRMNPQRLSKDHTGVTDYWYIILAINSYKSQFEFKDFKEPIFFPNTTFLNDLVTSIEREREKIK